MTRAQFLSAYRRELTSEATSAHGLERALSRATLALDGHRVAWWASNPMAQRAWTAIGGEGRVTLAGLRELPP